MAEIKMGLYLFKGESRESFKSDAETDLKNPYFRR